MTSQQLETLWSQLLGMGHTAALNAIYTIGYAAGAGITVDTNLDNKAKTATAPTVAQVQIITSSQKLKN